MAGNLKAAELRRLLAKGEFILAPGIYDGISCLLYTSDAADE